MRYSNIGLVALLGTDYPLGDFYGIPYREANVLLLSYLLAFSMSVCGEKYRNVTVRLVLIVSIDMSLEDAEKAAGAAICQLSAGDGVSEKLNLLETKKEDMPKSAVAVIIDIRTLGGLRDVMGADLLASIRERVLRPVA